MTIDKYVIIVREEAKNVIHEIPIEPETLQLAFEYNKKAIWLYIDAYLSILKKKN